MKSIRKKPLWRKKRRFQRRYELRRTPSYTALTLLRLLKGQIKPKRTTRVEEPLIPVSRQIVRRLCQDNQARVRVQYILRHYHDFPYAHPIKPQWPKWNLLRARGFSLIMSFPFLFKYKEYRQGYAKLIHIVFNAIVDCANSPLNTPVKFQLLTRKMVLIRTETSLQLRTTSTWAIWNVSPWWGMQLALLMANLYPITFGPTSYPLKIRWNLWRSWPVLKYWTVTPILYDKNPQIFKDYCLAKQLSLKFGVLFYIIDKFLDGDENNQVYYDLLQFIILNNRDPITAIHFNTGKVTPIVFGHWDPIPPKLNFNYKYHIGIPRPHKKEEQILAYIKMSSQKPLLQNGEG